jgi:DNA-binding transcriptional MerR regulator
VSEVDERLVVFSRPRIARLADVSQRRLDYWHRTGLITPEVDRKISPRRSSRLYSFGEALSVLIVVALLEQRVSLQQVRQIVHHVRSREHSLTELTFATVGSRVFFQTPDGLWEDANGGAHGQFVFRQVLDLRPLRATLKSATRRDNQSVGQVERRRGAMGSKPLIAGTRIPVESVQAFFDSGATDDEVLAAYPDLHPADLDKVRVLASA